MKKIIYYLSLIFLAIFLFVIHTNFLYEIIPGKKSDLFVLFNTDFKKYIPYLLGMTFGIVTASLLALLNDNQKLFWLFSFSIAICELIGVSLYINTELPEKIFKIFSASYYGIYTFIIIILYSYVKYSKNDLSKDTDEIIKESENIENKQESHENDKGEDEKMTNYEKFVYHFEKGVTDIQKLSEILKIHKSSVYRLKSKYDETKGDNY